MQWILEEVQASKMEEWWRETMTPKSLKLLEKEAVAKPKPKSQVRKAWEEYKAAEAEAEMAKRQLEEQAKKDGEQGDTPREEQGSLLREERLRQAVKRAKAPVQATLPVPEEKDDEMEEDAEDAMGTRETPIEVAAEVVAPQEVPKPVEAKPKPRVEGWKWPKPTSTTTSLWGRWGSGALDHRETKGE